jgi:hypothetical protein
VNGGQADNRFTDSGAAYVFTGLGIGPSLAFTPDSSGGYFIRLAGHAGFPYRLQRAPGVIGPWDTLDTHTAPASGLIEYHETNPPPGQAFYRTVQP